MSENDLFPVSAPGFEDPLGLLRACHERILAHCETLLKLVDHIESKGVDSEARQAASRVHHYFSTAGKLHHLDEEENLFPHLSRVSLKLADLVHRLRQQHTDLDTAWAAIEPSLKKPGDIESIATFRHQAETMASAYREHITLENSELLEMAQHLLSNEELAKLGDAMAQRRGLKPKY